MQQQQDSSSRHSASPQPEAQDEDSPNPQPQKQKKPRKAPARPRKANQLPQKIQNQINDPDYEWSESQVFVIEKIIGEEMWDGKKYYLTKWQGFDISMSTWEGEEKFKDMKDLVENFMKSRKGTRDKSISQGANRMMNPYRATEIHGHFLYGDEPEEIKNTIIQFDTQGRKRIYLQISWKQRQTQNGTLFLQNSLIQSDIVFDHDPLLLLNYYQKSIQLVPASNIPQNN